MIESRLNVDKIFQRGRVTIMKSRVNNQRTLPRSEEPEETYDDKDPRNNIYYGYFSLAGLSFFTASVHLFLMIAVIISAMSLKKDIKPNKVTQSINVWVPELKNQEILFPVSRELADNLSLSDTCKPFIPKTIPYENGIATIFPKILLYGEIDNRISIALFFFLSFAFQFFKAVNVRNFQDHPCKQNLWLGDRFYDNILKGRVSKAHFIEYSLSATLMILVMVTQIGITDLALIVNICVNTWACMIIGLLAEYVLDAEECPELKDQVVFGMHLSIITHFFGWIPLLSVIFSMVTPLATYKACIVGKVEIPTFVFAFVGGEIILFCSFGLVQYASIKNVQRIRDDAQCHIETLRSRADGMIARQQNQEIFKRNNRPKRISSMVTSNQTTDLREINDGDFQEIEDEFINKSREVNENKKDELIQNACAAEAWYVSLSLFAKSFLALTIYIGINTQPG
jgi:hypothetical protein